MAYSSLQKCTKKELTEFKEVVIDFLENYGIDTSLLDIRAFQQFGGDIRIYTNDYIESVNKKNSFRREKIIRNKDGVVYEGTRGHHTTIRFDPIIFNRDDFDEFLENKYETWNFIYDKLNKLKQSRI